MLAAMADALGFSTTKQTLFPSGKRWTELDAKEGTAVKNEAISTVSKRFNERVEALQKTSQWDKMDNEKQSEAIDKIKKEETDRVLKKYGI